MGVKYPSVLFKERFMATSRRSFLAGTSALIAAVACSRAFGTTMGQLNPKKGLGGAAPGRSGLLTRWYYNWGAAPSHKGMPLANPAMQFFPMIWGWYPQKTPMVLQRLREQHPSILLGYNEPDHKDQSNMTVETALETWPMFEGIASELVSPAAANARGPWMDKFMRGVEKKKLRVDSIAVHNYGPPSVEQFLNILHDVHGLYQRPIWVTEFAVADWQAKHGAANRFSVDQVAEFMQTACVEMDKIPWIKGYAWFPFAGKSSNALRTSVLFDADGNLNELGKVYARL
uniref:Asl1-like glycosyl hydrolase catalytic domain-containing protein n=1 Tax=Acidobacterium capsulatum TaxID=33075 RepID=A0A7V4XSB1_9BACT